MKKAIIIFFLCYTGISSAQVPGYEGKKFLLSYNLGIASNFFDALGSKPVGIFFNHNLDAEYVLDRRFSLEGEFSYLDNNFTERIKATGLGINCVFYPFKDNSLAPVGAYTKLKLFMKNYTASGTISDSVGNPLESTSTGQVFGIGLAFGHHAIVKDHILLSASIDMDFPISALGPEPDQLKSATNAHFLTTYAFYLKFGIGGLLF